MIRRLRDVLPAHGALIPLGVLALINGLDELDDIIFAILLPEIRRDFDLSLAEVGVIEAVIAPFALLLALPLAWLGDRVRRVRLASLGMMAWAGFTGLTGIAPGLAVLVIARIGSALGQGATVTHRSLLADWYPPQDRARALYAYSLANPVAALGGPVLAGALGEWFSWRVPIMLLVLPAAFLALRAGRLEEPTRGYHERRLAGADDDTARLEEEPAGWSETFRVLGRFPSARRIYLAIPFLAAANSGLGLLVSSFLDERFDLGPAARGGFMTAVAPFALVALVASGILVQRRLDDAPSAAVKVLAACLALSTLDVLLLAAAPNLPVVYLALAIDTLLTVGLTTGLYVVATVVVPPRMRTLGLAAATAWAVLGVLGLPAAGALADAHGLRLAFVAFAPVNLVAALLVLRAAATVDTDIARSQQSARVRAEARRQRDEGDPRLLVVDDLHVSYGTRHVLTGVSFELRDGELVALVGTNGAGKSTLFSALSGLVAPTDGSVIFDGIELSGADPAKTTRLGMVHAPGGRQLFGSLSVERSLRAAGWRRRRSDRRAAVDEVLERFPALGRRRDLPAGELSGGEAQLLNLAQALIARPRLVLLDELTSGLSPETADEVLAAVADLHASGTTVILVEQSIDRALRIAPRAVVIERGRVAFDGPSHELRDRPDLIRAVFLAGAKGVRRTVQERLRRAACIEQAPVALAAQGVRAGYAGIEVIRGVDLEVRTGEILGVVGANGAGKTTLLDVLSGHRRCTAGRVLLEGTAVEQLGAPARARLGLGRTFQDGRLYPNLTVWETVAVAAERHVTDANPLHAMLRLPEVTESEAAVRERVDAAVAALGLGPWSRATVAELSTGTRRLVEFAGVLVNRPAVLLLDEPTAGLAQREAEAFAPLLRRVADEIGCSVVLVEHDMGLVAAVSDRLLALEVGSVAACGRPAEILRERETVAG